MITSINPWTGEELARFPTDEAGKVNGMLDSAVRAQAQWRKVPIAERVKLLRRLAQTLRDRKEDCAQLITMEMGKPIVEAEAEI